MSISLWVWFFFANTIFHEWRFFFANVNFFANSIFRDDKFLGKAILLCVCFRDFDISRMTIFREWRFSCVFIFSRMLISLRSSLIFFMITISHEWRCFSRMAIFFSRIRFFAMKIFREWRFSFANFFFAHVDFFVSLIFSNCVYDFREWWFFRESEFSRWRFFANVDSCALSK